MDDFCTLAYKYLLHNTSVAFVYYVRWVDVCIILVLEEFGGCKLVDDNKDCALSYNSLQLKKCIAPN